jgi:DNA-binding NtrC family response regulator
MSHSLIRIDSAAHGQVHPLERRMTSLGSEPRNAICIQAEGVQPHHAYIVFQMGRWEVRALDPNHPVLLNAVAISGQVALKEGDELGLGSARFRLGESGDGQERAVRLALDVMETARKEGEPNADGARLVVDVLTRMVGESDRFRLLPMILRELAQRLRCDGAQLIFAGAESAPQTRVTHPEGAARNRFSSSALNEAQRRETTVLLSHTDLQALPTQESIQLNDIRSVLCGPLPFETDGHGFLYLDRLAGHPGFTAEEREEFEGWRAFFAELLTRSLREENQRYTISELQKRHADILPGLGAVFECDAMRRCFLEAGRVAGTQVPVLILGETGTGKEVLARFVHKSSPRKDGPFVAINCGAIPETLMESEFFGHEKGAFTGANTTKIGLIESASNGTLFLDELGELPLSLQVKLLRVLQQGELVRVGGTATIPVNFRLVSATHRELQREVDAGRFRPDLFFRVNVIQLSLPGLRDRDRDPILLARHYLKLYAAQYGTGPKELGRAAEKAILTHSWPGNVRELENRVQKAVILSTEERITPTDLGLEEPEAGLDFARDNSLVLDTDSTLYEVRARAERQCIEQALAKSQGNVSLVSRMLDVDRKVLIRLIERLDLKPDSYKRKGS